MKVLLATDNRFWENDNGSKQRICALLAALGNAGIELHVFFVGQFGESELARIDRWAAPDRFFSFQTRQAGRGRSAAPSWRQRLTGLFARRPDLAPGLERFFAAETREQFARRCRQLQPDMVIVEYIRLSYLLTGSRRRLPARTRFMIDTHDVMHHRCEMFRRCGKEHWLHISRDEEKQELERFDYVIAIQESDAERFAGMVGADKVVVLKHAFAVNPPDKTAAGERTNLLFVGSDNDPNEIAIRTFLGECWPALTSEFGVRLAITMVGGVCARFAGEAFPGTVVLKGLVPDLAQEYRAADIVINPVAFGGGLKIKNIEALCHAKPLMTTTIGAEGIEEGAGRAFFVCNGPDEQIEKLRELILDPQARREAARQAYLFADRRFSEQAVYGDFVTFLKRLVA